MAHKRDGLPKLVKQHKRNAFETEKKIPINDNQKHFILFILQDHSPPSVWRNKSILHPYQYTRSACHYKHTHTLSLTHSHARSHTYYTEEHCQKCTQNIQSQDKLKKRSVNFMDAFQSRMHLMRDFPLDCFLHANRARRGHFAGDMLNVLMLGITSALTLG